MARFSPTDIILEIVELSRDIMVDIKQQLNYYRASVYKHETAGQIKSKVEQLRLVVELTGDEMLQDAFRDHDAMLEAGVVNYIPGECSFSSRTSRLVTAIEEQLALMVHSPLAQNSDIASKSLEKKIQKYRRELLSLCRYGSRQWAFFQAF